ncbi:MAG: DUF1376 domain-containing protein [Ramlibacter sp.]|nr:DUF1376 domain-containing protein [Ramlibacter sp.]
MNYFEHHIGDYDADTAHLSWLEDMAYTRLMRLYYRKEAPIPADVSDACRLIRAVTKEQKQAVESVLKEFFTPGLDGWRQKRCDADVARYQAKAERNREVGKLGGRPRNVGTQTKPPGLFVGTQEEPKPNPLQSPDTKHQAPEPSTKEQDTDAIASAASAKPPRAGRKCPGSFALTPELLEFAGKFPTVDCQAETEKLRDHTFKNAISDWPGAWRNWIRRAADGAQQTRASPMSFAERDELAAIARVHEMTGGLVSAKPFTPRRPDALQEVFDARTAARKMDHVAVRPDASALRLGLVEQVERG